MTNILLLVMHEIVSSFNNLEKNCKMFVMSFALFMFGILSTNALNIN